LLFVVVIFVFVLPNNNSAPFNNSVIRKSPKLYRVSNCIARGQIIPTHHWLKILLMGYRTDLGKHNCTLLPLAMQK